MLKMENTEIKGWGAAIRGMRNPKNSWDRSDSEYHRSIAKDCDECGGYEREDGSCDECWFDAMERPDNFTLGPNDYELAARLASAGPVHGKFLRMITVYADVIAPLYWWKEYDTYKVGTVANSCSTMHKIADKEFTMDDFSHEHLRPLRVTDGDKVCDSYDFSIALTHTLFELNVARRMYLETGDKAYWWQMIQLLPSSYNQRRTIMLNYAVLANIYHSRRNHKLDEWHTFCDWIESLPYAELITGKETGVKA